jgi:oligo-alginate lyase
MKSSESISRRSLIKLMAMATPAMGSATSIIASATHNRSAVNTAVVDLKPRRPRLFYNDAAVRRMRRMLASDAGADAALKQKGEELLAAKLIPESDAEIGGGQQAHYALPGNQITEMGLTLGLLFHLTGDRRYADKLREALLYYTKYMRWAGPGLADRSPPWHSELDTAKFSFGYSAGYDALRDILSDADKKTIADGMVRLAVLPILNDWVLPGARVHSFDSMGHNWWGVCVAGGGLCSLALLGDDPRAQQWIDAVDTGFVQWFNYSGNVLQNRMPTFERSGPSYEGVHYTNYGISEYLHYRFAWQNTYPDRRAAYIEPLGHVVSYLLQTLYPTSKGFYSVNFDDALIDEDSTATVLLLIACGLGNPDCGRYLKHVSTHSQDTLLALLRQYIKPFTSGEAPLSSIYPHMGWAMMRSSWDKDATFLAMKSGFTWNHAHADAGSFILFKQGMPLIIDSGTCAYSRPEYNSYYRYSRAHNVILFDGAGQPEEDINSGCKFPGQMHCLIDGLGMKYAYADATGPMARWFRRNYRHWLWSGDVVFVIDAVIAFSAGKMDWLLHYDGEFVSNSDGSVTLKNGPAEAVVKILHPRCKHREDVGLADHNPDKKVHYLVFSPETPEQSQQFITAICLNPASPPKLEMLGGTDYLGVSMQTQDSI